MRQPLSHAGGVEHLRDADLEHAVEIAPRVWWVGHYIPDDPFHCHVYLLEQGDQSVLVDPGPLMSFDVTRRKIEEVTPFGNVRYFVCQHPDPDITAALPAIDRLFAREDAYVVTTWRAKMLLQHYGLRMPFWLIEDHDWELALSDRSLRFIFTPYMHFPGAYASFDETSGVLFSSDIFGGFSDGRGLVALDETHFETVRLFHEHYMPSRDIVARCMEKFEELSLTMIAPQHGSIIPAKLAGGIMDRLKRLNCGIYLLAEKDANLLRLSNLNRALHDLNGALVRSRDFTSIAKSVIEICERLLPLHSVEFLSLCSDSHVLRLAPEHGFRIVEIEAPPWLDGALSDAISSGKRHILRTPTPGCGPTVAATVLLPLAAADGKRAQAAAVLHLRQHIADDEIVAHLMAELAIPLAVALQRELLSRDVDLERQRLYELSTHDALTGLYNRVFMEATIPHAIALHDRNPQAQLAVLMCDIDHFKAINDTYGHAAGDDALREFANVLRLSIRISDVAVRIGGEEFVVFLLGSTGSDGNEVAERIRAGLSRHDFAHGVGRVTVSIGIAVHQQREELEDVLRRSDAALYRAKQSGRDQICFADWAADGPRS